MGDFLRWTRRQKVAQIILVLCCFSVPILLMPLALHESGTDLWLHAGLSKSTVNKVLIADGMVPLRYALIVGKGVYRTSDNGISWLPVNNGLPSDSRGRIRAQTLAVSEANPSVVYAGVGGVATRNNMLSAGLYLTEDGGATWLEVGKDMAGKEVQAIAVMPEPTSFRPIEKLGPGASVVCVATNEGIYCNTGEGQSWLRLGWQGVEIRVLSLAIRPGHPNVIYAGTQGYGLYATENSGGSWTEMNRGLHDLEICDIAISEVDPRLMYLATNGGVYKSTDAGSVWTKSGGATQGRHINTIAIHPQDASILYAGLQHGAAYCSTDGGGHWVPLKRGLGNLTVLSLAIDPRNTSVLWAGTVDGIWRCVLEAPASSTPTSTVTAVSATSEFKPTHTVTPHRSATPPLTETPTCTVTLTPTATPEPSQTTTCTPRPSPTRTMTRTPTSTATAMPPPPTSAPPIPIETPALR